MSYSTTGEYFPQSRAVSAVNAAIRAGRLVRPKVCELCGKEPKKNKRPTIQAHHWNGYDHPLDVWWLCSSCNMFLSGKWFHVGKIGKEEARKYIESKKIKLPSVRCSAIGKNGKQCARIITGGIYCHDHKESNQP